MGNIVVTTSWDDGHVLDLKLAELLDRYGCAGTFYIPQHYLNDALSRWDIVQLATSFEISAHSLTHRRLDQLDREDARNEINGSKAYLEDILGRPVEMFCYPRGLYSSKIADMVREAGFVGARTTEKFTFRVQDPYAMGTTVQCYPYPLRKVSRDRYMLGRSLFQPIQQTWRHVLGLHFPLRAFVNWFHLARATFDHVSKYGGIWHLFGHSWEIERYGMWDQLAEILRYASKRSGVLYMTNRDVVRDMTLNRSR